MLALIPHAAVPAAQPLECTVSIGTNGGHAAWLVCSMPPLYPNVPPTVSVRCDALDKQASRCDAALHSKSGDDAHTARDFHRPGLSTDCCVCCVLETR